MARRKSPASRSRPSAASSSPLSALLKLLPKRLAVIAGAAVALLALLPEKWRPFPLPELPSSAETAKDEKPRKAKVVKEDGAPAPAPRASTRPALREFPASIVSVADGDTVTAINTDTGEKVKVRFAGIDTPESRQAFGAEAKRELERLLNRKGKLSILPRETDRYGRTVGDLYLDGGWINLEMVRSGHAWHYAAYSKDARLAAAMETARKERRGLWAERSPVPPWEWRKQRRAK